MSDPCSVTVFSRHNLFLHALLWENQPWFSARDVGRLIGFHLNDRVVNKLDSDNAALCGLSTFENRNSI
ncbi:hypothetical protein PMI37_04383 [Pseudomonas sp. GM80]|nr:hypothetical protein PMI37_04383 [Pseudomonas sp. GM80]